MNNISMLTPLITTVFGIVLAMIVELVSGFSQWWDSLEKGKKRSIRGLVGLLITILIALGHYFQLYDVGIGAVVTFNGILVLVFSWVTFVTGGEVAYQSASGKLPRKNNNPRYMAKT